MLSCMWQKWRLNGNPKCLCASFQIEHYCYRILKFFFVLSLSLNVNKPLSSPQLRSTFSCHVFNMKRAVPVQQFVSLKNICYLASLALVYEDWKRTSSFSSVFYLVVRIKNCFRWPVWPLDSQMGCTPRNGYTKSYQGFMQ